MPEALIQQPPSPTPGHQRACSTLLYVEDNASNLKLLGRVLERRPFTRLITATEGLPGLEMARAYRPDLILLDLHLPDMNGDEVLEHLLADPRTRDIPVIIISGDATQDTIQRLLAEGARAYVTKPFAIPGLLTLINNLLNGVALAPISHIL